MDLYYFRLIAEEGSITEATRKAQVSQQYLSKYLKRLEEHYDARLFIRRPRLALTQSGQLLLEHARAKDALETKLRDEFQLLHDPAVTQINLGLPRGLALAVFPMLATAFKQSHPKVKLSAVMGRGDNIASQLFMGKLDVAVGEYDAEHVGLSFESIRACSYKLAISQNTLIESFPDQHEELASGKVREIDIRDFQGIPFVGFQETSKRFYIIRRFLEQNRVQLFKDIRVNYTTMQLAIVRDSGHACIYPDFFDSYVSELNETADGHQLRTFSIKGFDYTSRLILLWHRRKTIEQPLIQELAQHIKRIVGTKPTAV